MPTDFRVARALTGWTIAIAAAALGCDNVNPFAGLGNSRACLEEQTIGLQPKSIVVVHRRGSGAGPALPDGAVARSGGTCGGWTTHDATCDACITSTCCTQFSTCAMDATCVSCFSTANPPSSCMNDAAYSAAYQCTSKCASACSGASGGSGGSTGGGSLGAPHDGCVSVAKAKVKKCSCSVADLQGPTCAGGGGAGGGASGYFCPANATCTNDGGCWCSQTSATCLAAPSTIKPTSSGDIAACISNVTCTTSLAGLSAECTCKDGSVVPTSCGGSYATCDDACGGPSSGTGTGTSTGGACTVRFSAPDANCAACLNDKCCAAGTACAKDATCIGCFDLPAECADNYLWSAIGDCERSECAAWCVTTTPTGETSGGSSRGDCTTTFAGCPKKPSVGDQCSSAGLPGIGIDCKSVPGVTPSPTQCQPLPGKQTEYCCLPFDPAGGLRARQ